MSQEIAEEAAWRRARARSGRRARRRRRHPGAAEQPRHWAGDPPAAGEQQPRRARGARRSPAPGAVVPAAARGRGRRRGRSARCDTLSHMRISRRSGAIGQPVRANLVQGHARRTGRQARRTPAAGSPSWNESGAGRRREARGSGPTPSLLARLPVAAGRAGRGGARSADLRRRIHPMSFGTHVIARRRGGPTDRRAGAADERRVNHQCRDIRDLCGEIAYVYSRELARGRRPLVGARSPAAGRRDRAARSMMRRAWAARSAAPILPDPVVPVCAMWARGGRRRHSPMNAAKSPQTPPPPLPVPDPGETSNLRACAGARPRLRRIRRR
ncbi:hypothetical protein SAMN02745121_03112 [Nannocystis exedens]|uniref:Uncharacterized protein n=1 Tax=Nannocystis exedens TaxID=54 RepID=A0A1I1Y3M0_9BACT|nr:hypothetical protein NAEX_04839 [Nannocystis exedens]SFE13578.1 hypothetical protein SAMN02745121_03112 [Nannocystis exedens]